MAEVVFITGLGEPLTYASRLIRKKHRAGERVAVFGPPPLLARLDQLLWTEDAQDFLVHLRLRPGESVDELQREHTAIWLLEAPDEALRCSTAVNLGLADVTPLAGFDRIAELVPGDPEAAKAARQRWKRYGELGLKIQHHPQDA